MLANLVHSFLTGSIHREKKGSAHTFIPPPLLLFSLAPAMASGASYGEFRLRKRGESFEPSPPPLLFFRLLISAVFFPAREKVSGSEEEELSFQSVRGIPSSSPPSFPNTQLSNRWVFAEEDILLPDRICDCCGVVKGGIKFRPFFWGGGGGCVTYQCTR